MKKFLFLLFVTFIFIGCLQTETTKEKTKLIGMPNPWTDCGNNLVQAAEIAGFTFPLVLSNYHVRAMKGMIQISYPLDEFRTVLVRKTDVCSILPSFQVSWDMLVNYLAFSTKDLSINQN